MIPLMNASPKPIRAQFGGMFTLFVPGQVREDIFDSYAARHMVSRWGKYGLVDMTFDKLARAKYAEYDVFEHNQRIKGMENYIKTLRQQLLNFDIYMKETGDKISVQKALLADKRALVEKDLAEATELLNKLKKRNPVKTPQERKEALLKQIADLDIQLKLIENSAKGSNVNNASRPT